jgi:multimeric flavodoxin WrbA
LIKLLTISGSPVEGSSTEFILAEIADALVASFGADNRVQTTTIRLNDLKYIPCQSCGKSPAPEYCLYDDDLTPVYRALVECDCLLFGSPVYFDSVTAQAKMFIDRCNCFRPPDFDNVDPDHYFLRRLTRLRPAAMVLVGGEQGWFEGARRVLAGFFKWVQLVDEGTLIYRSTDFTRIGAAREDSEIRQQALELGNLLARRILDGYEERES